MTTVKVCVRILGSKNWEIFFGNFDFAKVEPEEVHRFG